MGIDIVDIKMGVQRLSAVNHGMVNELDSSRRQIADLSRERDMLRRLVGDLERESYLVVEHVRREMEVARTRAQRAEAERDESMAAMDEIKSWLAMDIRERENG